MNKNNDNHDYKCDNFILEGDVIIRDNILLNQVVSNQKYSIELLKRQNLKLNQALNSVQLELYYQKKLNRTWIEYFEKMQIKDTANSEIIRELKRLINDRSDDQIISTHETKDDDQN